MAIRVGNYCPNSVFIRKISLELADRNTLFFPLDYLTNELNTRRELKTGESCGFHISLLGLFSDGRTPEQFVGVHAVDDIDRTFRFEGEEFNKIIEALYATHVRVGEEHTLSQGLQAPVSCGVPASGCSERGSGAGLCNRAVKRVNCSSLLAFTMPSAYKDLMARFRIVLFSYWTLVLKSR